MAPFFYHIDGMGTREVSHFLVFREVSMSSQSAFGEL
jgi:hypothetical protein